MGRGEEAGAERKLEMSFELFPPSTCIMLPPPPPSKPAKVPQTSTLFKHHCFCLRLSKESKESFDKESWTNKVLANGGQVALPPVFSPKTSTFLVTDVDYPQLQSVYGTSTLVSGRCFRKRYRKERESSSKVNGFVARGGTGQAQHRFPQVRRSTTRSSTASSGE